MTGGQATQGNSTSSVLGRRLGGELTKLRTTAGLTQPQAAKALSASTAKVTKMERGWVPIRDPDIRVLCELYGVTDPATVGGLLELARVDRERRKAKGWWSDCPALGDMQEYVTLESAATVIRTWQLSYVPGLLQTPRYARTLNDDEQFVAARIARQQRLTDEPSLSLHAVIFEAVLRNLVSGAGVMREQLEHLSAMADRPGISLQVLPFSAGATQRIHGAFNIISFADPGELDVVYTEGPLTHLWIEGKEKAAKFAELFESIAQQALNERDSQAFIKHISEEL
ncbi:helix-turn-helix transcriptional regulator [Streptomyces sp. XD-27]|uniref:helix-turn-helix domain-containing protein n=1 Tax=Streptomyces sp. XD-27 TaxID=3062779 RepID=UPI0026F420F6|nr:helix-turn-helix transcriptional regulator [Streptomyces sp. XD-27]WKX70200.1 helix-turn-helix transcriptional regulator [Streptomyces sp. XD-27]